MSKRIHNDVSSLGDITIMECVVNPPFEEAKFTFRIGVKESHKYFVSLDAAVLGALEYKYLGLNSQFAEFACKMLDIKI